MPDFEVSVLELSQKLKILSDGAKYDVACTSSGSARKSMKGGLGYAVPSGICHSFSSDGRCISLLKVLMSNCCIYDCAYCVNRISNDIPRTTFTPEEITDLTVNFYRRNYIEGLFLSSAVVKNPDYTMEMIIRVVRSLRLEHRFNGYIHIKAIPGADYRLIKEAGSYVDRMSVNIELPTSEGLRLLAPQKKKEEILGPMNFISRSISENTDDRKVFRSAPGFVPAGQSTQLIVGATPDNDLRILKLSEGLYRRYSLKRVFYSAYVPVNTHPNLPSVACPPLLREHRLYQADWLLRFYGYRADELLDESHPDFNTRLDPKCDWALRNLHYFPVEINKADYYMLLRVPGIGVRSAQRIMKARRVSSLGFDDLKKLGVVMKRARYFITCRGRYYDRVEMNDAFITQNLLCDRSKTPASNSGYRQVSMFPSVPELPSPLDVYSSVTGEI
jgi:putative DNA modification/repair radical SAM protein